jgi:hypothetical protein
LIAGGIKNFKPFAIEINPEKGYLKLQFDVHSINLSDEEGIQVWNYFSIGEGKQINFSTENALQHI